MEVVVGYFLKLNLVVERILEPLFLTAETYNILVIEGRFCSAAAGISCCLPCPNTDWLYPDSFGTMTEAASWINVVGLVCQVFMLLSWAFLPASKTARHYLSICLVIATMMMGVSQSFCRVFSFRFASPRSCPPDKRILEEALIFGA